MYARQDKIRLLKAFAITLALGLFEPFQGTAQGQCSLNCPIGAVSEPEPCGLSLNDGCNLATPAYTAITCPQTICGTAWAQNDSRDVDWYTLTVTDGDGDGVAQITATLFSEFPAVVFILNNDCVTSLVFAQGQSDNCSSTTIEACVNAPGTYRVFVSTGSAEGAIFNGIPCDGVKNDYVLSVTCSDICTAPPNDDWANALPITDGATFFSTVNATTDGPAHLSCDPADTVPTQVDSDIWYRYTATCTGDLIVENCNSTNFDSRIAIYDGCVSPASDTNLLFCNDELTSCDGGSSALFAPVVAGNCYLIRIGGFSGAQGLGTIRLSCWPNGLCPDTGDCNVANGSPSCDDTACCEAVCAFDQYCCLVEWDDLCAQEAFDVCFSVPTEACCFNTGTCLQLTASDCQSSGGTPQGAGTSCASLTCNATAPEACCLAAGVCIFTTPADCIGFGGSPQGPGTACGTSLCLPEACCFNDLSCQDLTPEECITAGGAPGGVGSACESFSCGPVTEACCLTTEVCINADPVDCIGFAGTPLGPGTICEANSCKPPCPSDIEPLSGPDGNTNVTDLLALLASWGPCAAACAADINTDGTVNVTDLLVLLGGWGPCP
ncbi:MAG: hypothetical protein IID30_10475 [Planctomycetes bacterium]|nr:hypothetical protein [Planctomycetota bacterium]